MHTEFQSLPLPRKDFAAADAGNYRVYSDNDHFVVVNAMNALEAMQSSGINNPLRIKRDSLDLTQVFAPKDWETIGKTTAGAPAEKAPAPEAPAAEAAAAAAEPAAEKTTVEVPLSNDDVDKLLNG